MTNMDHTMRTPDPALPDLNLDEVRRTLREVQRDHVASLAPFDAALDQAFDPDGGASDDERAHLLGLPNRRGFLKIGGLTIGLAALAAACVNPDKQVVQLPQTGTLAQPTTTVVRKFHGSPEVDATLVLTALSLERLAIDVYEAGGAFLIKPLLQDVAKYFQSQHRDHADLLAAQATRMGQQPGEVKPNPLLNTSVVQPALETITSAPSKEAKQLATLRLALDLEDAAAQTYTKAGGLLTTTGLRQAILSIGAIEAKHYTLLAYSLGEQTVPFSFGHTSGAAPDDALIAPNGPVAKA